MPSQSKSTADRPDIRIYGRVLGLLTCWRALIIDPTFDVHPLLTNIIVAKIFVYNLQAADLWNTFIFTPKLNLSINLRHHGTHKDSRWPRAIRRVPQERRSRKPLSVTRPNAFRKP